MRVRAEMTGDPRRRPAGWWIGALGLLAIAAWVTYETIDVASRPNGYAGRNQTPATWVFPAAQVQTWLSIMGAELVLAVIVLQARVQRLSLAGRAVLLAALSFVGMVAMSPLLMHSSAPIPQHLLWLFLAAIWLAVFALGAGVHGMILRDRARQAAIQPRPATTGR